MKNSWIKRFILIAAILCGGAGSLRAAEAVEVIVNESVPAAALEKGALKDILTGKTMYWEGGQAVTIILPGDKADNALQELSGMSASQFKTHWQRLVFSGRGKQPKTADDADKAVALVASTKGAVAIVPAGTKLNGVKKLDLK
jgi:ABC-type phosphate transport system substrate-binding protein